MIEKSLLLEPKEPWVMRTTGEFQAVSQKLETTIHELEGASLYIMNGREMRTGDKFDDEIVRVLKFPDYYGRNFNALDECITDLEWLDRTGFLILIQEGNIVLDQEKLEVLEGFLDILTSAGQEWSEPVQLGEAWDRGPVPFHVVFHMNVQGPGILSDLPFLNI